MFDDDYLNKSKHLQPTIQIAQETLRLLRGVPFPEEIKVNFVAGLALLDLATLQAFWVYICDRGHTEIDAPPEWKAQRHRGLASAALGQ